MVPLCLTCLVLDDEGLFQLIGESLPQRTGKDVVGATGRKRDHDGHGLAGVGLCHSNLACQPKREGEKCQPGAARDIVTLNAGAALYAANVAASIAEGVERARVAIESGAAKAKLAQFVAFSQTAV